MPHSWEDAVQPRGFNAQQRTRNVSGGSRPVLFQFQICWGVRPVKRATAVFPPSSATTSLAV
jgi:hypothetical protein